MKLEIPGYKPQEIYNHFMQLITDEYQKLKKEYGEFPIIYGADEIYRMETQWQMTRMFPEMQKTENFINEYMKCYNSRSFMHTQLISMVNNPMGKMVIQYIWVGHAQIVDRIFSGLNHLDIVEDFFKVSLRHEYGHCLHNKKIFEMAGYDVDKASHIIHTMVNDRDNGMMKLHDKYTSAGKKPDEEYYKIYHSLPMEKDANELMGLTYRDHWRCLELLDFYE